MTGAAAFVLCGEFADLEEALSRPAVNFTTLGYGDIIMSRRQIAPAGRAPFARAGPARGYHAAG
jgi:hypothetical protein